MKEYDRDKLLLEVTRGSTAVLVSMIANAGMLTAEVIKEMKE